MKKLSFLLTILCFSTFLTQETRAITLSLTPASQIKVPGGIAHVFLDVTGLTAGGPDSLGAFSLDITFDPNILSFGSAVFHNFIGDPDLDQSLFYTTSLETDIFVDSSTPGNVYLDELSLLLPSDLDSRQADSFRLANLSFVCGPNLGLSDVVMQNVVLSDAFGTTFSNPTLRNASVNVVPEPATLLLVGCGLLGGIALKRRERKGA